MKRLFKKAAAVMMICVLALNLTACMDDYDETSEESAEEGSTRQEVNAESGGENVQGDRTEGTWAVYVYMCGSDLESEGGFATDDLMEMTLADLPDNVNFIIETGGASSWNNNEVNADAIDRFAFTSKGFELVDEQEQADMGESDTLADFLKYCNKNYPADNRMLLFWDHGGGSVGGVTYDENYDYDSLTLPEMSSAMSEAGFGGDNKLDMIGFDTCLMATLDNAEMCANYADYMVASEESEPSCGWNYQSWVQSLADDTGMGPVQIGKNICDSYIEGCADEAVDDEATLSLTDLSKIAPLSEAFDNMGTEIFTEASQDTAVCGDFARSAVNAENYGGNNDEDGYANMVDLGDLVSNSEKILPETSETVLNALKDAVIYSVHGDYKENSNGLSVYYPYNGDTDELASYIDMESGSEENDYQCFLQYSLGMELPSSAGETSGEVTAFNADMPITIDDDGYITLSIDPSELGNVKDVYFMLAYYSEEDDMMICLGTDNDLDADWDNGVFKDNFRGVWGALDGNLCYMEITYEGDDYNLYSVPVMLNGEERVMRVVYDYNTSEYTILGTRKEIDGDNGMADKNLRKLQNGDEVTPILYAASISGDDDFEEYTADTVTVTDDTSFEEMDMGDGKFCMMYQVIDTMNNEKDSDLAMIDYENGEISTSLDDF